MPQDKPEPNMVPALRFKQWLKEWDGYAYNEKTLRRKPEPYLYVFTMKAGLLRQLCGVYKRERHGAEAEGIQRYQDPKRIARIQRYVRYGYPYGDLTEPQRTPDKDPDKKPGWIPTAIVVNILRQGDSRKNLALKTKYAVQVNTDDKGHVSLTIPDVSDLQEAELAPLEVIDGQHRLWSFERGVEDEISDDFELAVVAFNGLDLAWQAYLFWSINVSPVKINPSHAFDLYPLLRTQDWLDNAGDLKIYREARAQELTQVMYSNKASAWHHRVNMLGETRSGAGVTQAAWVRSLTGSFLSSGLGAGRKGLFHSLLPDDDQPLDWSLTQQAAFIICLWGDIKVEVEKEVHHWIRQYKPRTEAFSGKASLLNQDMGVRAIHSVVNDIFYTQSKDWRLNEWFPNENSLPDAEDLLAATIADMGNQYFRPLVRELAVGLARFDWRSLEMIKSPDEKGEAQRKRSYRGSGGYTALRHDILDSISEMENATADVAKMLLRTEERNAD